MKNFLYTCFILCTTFSIAISQESSNDNFTKEYGINATSFVNTFLSFNDLTNNTNNYLATYKAQKDNGRYLRLGGNFRINSRIDNPDDNTSNFDKRETFLTDLDFRVGQEKQIPIVGNWGVNVGMDFIGGYFNSSVKTDDTKLSRHSGYIGAGPIAGFQYMINDRIGLLTEANLYLSIAASSDKASDNVGDDVKDRDFSANLSAGLPTNLIFFMRF